jgi:hypothetical protein
LGGTGVLDFGYEFDVVETEGKEWKGGGGDFGEVFKFVKCVCVGGFGGGYGCLYGAEDAFVYLDGV